MASRQAGVLEARVKLVGSLSRGDFWVAAEVGDTELEPEELEDACEEMVRALGCMGEGWDTGLDSSWERRIIG